jgi:predicted ribosome quality control (RQC) complex YloA/Tae2 family protein
MSYDGLITRAIVKELNSSLIDSRVEKIYVPNKSEVIFNLHSNKSSLKLLISIDASNARIHLTKQIKENPIKAPQFCMVLRKHLQGARILNINQYNLDRIIVFSFENLDDFGELVTKKLVIEIMGKHSNIILLNDTNKIIDSIKHVDNTISSIREVLPAREYVYPENQDRYNFLGMSMDEFVEIVGSQIGSETATFPTILANTFVGFSRTFTNNLCEHLKVKDKLTVSELQKMYSLLRLMQSNIDKGLVELKAFDNDYHFDLDIFATHNQEPLHLSEYIDNFYSNRESNDKLKSSKADLQREVQNHINKFKKKLDIAEKALNEAESLEKYKVFGDLISSNIYRMTQGLKEITVENFYDNNNPVTIPLKENFSPSRNAQDYFKKYNKLKNTRSHAEEQKNEYLQNLNYLETVHFQIEECESQDDILEIKQELINEGYIKKDVKPTKKVPQVSEPLKFNMNNIEILVGKNNIQNDRLTLKIAKKSDTWLHTKQIHGSHVIIRSEIVPDDVLEYAAKLAVEHSKAKGSKNVQVDYTLVKNVHKPSGAKPGMVIYTDYKTVVI